MKFALQNDLRRSWWGSLTIPCPRPAHCKCYSKQQNTVNSCIAVSLMPLVSHTSAISFIIQIIFPSTYLQLLRLWYFSYTYKHADTFMLEICRINNKGISIFWKFRGISSQFWSKTSLGNQITVLLTESSKTNPIDGNQTATQHQSRIPSS